MPVTTAEQRAFALVTASLAIREQSVGRADAAEQLHKLILESIQTMFHASDVITELLIVIDDLLENLAYHSEGSLIVSEAWQKYIEARLNG